MEKLFYLTEKMSNLRRKKEETEGRGNVMLESLKFVAEKWNPYDTFPEENGYRTPIEILEFLQTIIRDIEEIISGFSKSKVFESNTFIKNRKKEGIV